MIAPKWKNCIGSRKLKGLLIQDGWCHSLALRGLTTCTPIKIIIAIGKKAKITNGTYHASGGLAWAPNGTKQPAISTKAIAAIRNHIHSFTAPLLDYQ